MKHTKLEPGLLQVFRWLIAIRLILSLFGWTLKWLSIEQRTLRFPLPGIIEATLLLGYLSLPWLRSALGRIYLPPALFVASAGPVLEQALEVGLRLRAGVPPLTATQDLWPLIFVLFVPLILTSWQYNYIAVVILCLGTATLELALYLPMFIWGGISYINVFFLTALRSLLFLLVGYVIVRLARAQREQQAALAQANRRLAHFATTLEQLATSRERNRMARELHDTLAHTLSGVAVQLEAVRSLWESDPKASQVMLEQALSATRDGLGAAREAIHALRTTPLEGLGLALAIRNLAQSAAERSELDLELQLPETAGEIAPAVEQVVYRIAEEALTNVTRHAQARSLLVRLTRKGDELTLVVSDDGRGFDPGQSPPAGHYGLQGMYERAEMVGGELEVKSEIGRGTQIRLAVEAEP